MLAGYEQIINRVFGEKAPEASPEFRVYKMMVRIWISKFIKFYSILMLILNSIDKHVEQYCSIRSDGGKSSKHA